MGTPTPKLERLWIPVTGAVGVESSQVLHHILAIVVIDEIERVRRGVAALRIQQFGQAGDRRRAEFRAARKSATVAFKAAILSSK